MTDLERHAYHEAGHAAACILLNRKFTHVDVIPRGNYLGGVYNTEKRNGFDDLMISGAGMYAERIKYNQYPHVNDGGYIDAQEMNAVIIKVYGPQNLTVINREVMEKCDYLLRANWLTVEKIALALMEKKSLTYEEVKQIIH